MSPELGRAITHCRHLRAFAAFGDGNAYDAVSALIAAAEQLRNDLDYVRTCIDVVLTSPVCHPHNAIVLREIVAEINERLGDDPEVTQ